MVSPLKCDQISNYSSVRASRKLLIPFYSYSIQRLFNIIYIATWLVDSSTVIINLLGYPPITVTDKGFLWHSLSENTHDEVIYSLIAHSVFFLYSTHYT